MGVNPEHELIERVSREAFALLWSLKRCEECQRSHGLVNKISYNETIAKKKGTNDRIVLLKFVQNNTSSSTRTVSNKFIV